MDRAVELLSLLAALSASDAIMSFKPSTPRGNDAERDGEDSEDSYDQELLEHSALVACFTSMLRPLHVLNVTDELECEEFWQWPPRIFKQVIRTIRAGFLRLQSLVQHRHMFDSSKSRFPVFKQLAVVMYRLGAYGMRLPTTELLTRGRFLLLTTTHSRGMS